MGVDRTAVNGKVVGDMPFIAKTATYVTKKDQVMAYVTGLSAVNFSDAQLETCLTSGFVGTAELNGEVKDETQCMGLAHLYW
jgi:hypothetical protein